MTRREMIQWSRVGAALVIVAVVVPLWIHHLRAKSITIQGAVVRRDSDSRKELPIADAVVTASDGVSSTSTQSDNLGYFKIAFPRIVWPGRTVVLSFRHAGYRPLDLKLEAGPRLTARQLYVGAMEPIFSQAGQESGHPPVLISNIRIRYTVNSQTEMNIGSAVNPFQVVNKGNVPCNHQLPCSPDGNWKASSGSISLDAGPGNEFRDVRVSCIAGPCPFTKIDSSGFVDGGRNITASALDWSDTATLLLEAEVFHSAITSNVRELYPVVFGEALNFTAPPTEEGVSIEADVDATPMVFPLGPDINLSWATCTARISRDREKATVYRCELKPGYRF